MTSEAGGVGIGARLRAARERRGLTVLQAAEKLHVDARVLENLEAEDFAQLGADVYARGHLRRYAELIGESPGQLQDLYANASPATRPDLTRIPRGERAPESARFLLPALLGVIVLTLAGLLWWLLTLPGAKPQPLSPATTNPALSLAPEAPADTPAGAGSANATSAVAGAPAMRAKSGAQTLTLRFSGASWVQILDAQGQVLLEGLQAPASTRSVTGAAPLRVVLGNATAVALEVNGHPASFAALVRRRGDAHLVVDAAGALAAGGGSPSGRGD